MSEPSDASLLKAWTDEESEDAFAMLARRYAGLLYHAAMRRTGSGDLAGEAAQNTLLLLARKASGLGKHPSLSAWLHRTVCFEASMLMRRERRHEARMKKFQLHHESVNTQDSWQEIAPLLDQALDTLSEKDRQVIFLKYFDGLSFEQMARQFGGEAAAWRQRGSRAVDRLRLSFTKRGVTVSSGTLAMGLGTTLSQAAPVSVIATISASPATAAAAISWQTLTLHSIHLMKMKPAVVITVALFLSIIPLCIQAKAIADTRQRVTLLEGSAAHALTASSAAPQGSRPLPVDRQNTTINLLSLADALMAASKGDEIKRFTTDQQIQALGIDELERLMQASADLEMAADKRLVLIRALFQEYCRLAAKFETPCERVLTLATRLASQVGTNQGYVWGIATGNFGNWMEADPAAALAWYRNARESGILGEPQRATVFASHAFNGLYRTNPAEAIEFYRSSSDKEREAIILGGGGRGNPDLMVELAAEIGDERLRREALTQVFRDSDGKSSEEIHSWLDRLQLPSNEATQLLAEAAKVHGGRASGMEVGKRIDWLRETNAGLNSSHAAGILLADVAQSDPKAAPATLDAEWKRNPDEQMLAAYMSRCFSDEELILDAIPRSRLITDPKLRDATLHWMIHSTRENSEARELARKGGLSQEEIDRIIPQKP